MRKQTYMHMHLILHTKNQIASARSQPLTINESMKNSMSMCEENKGPPSGIGSPGWEHIKPRSHAMLSRG
jgi:hypothetical protein